MSGAGRIAQVSLGGSVKANYLYGGRSRLSVRQTLNQMPSGTTHLIYDVRDHVLVETNGAGQAVRECIWLGDLPVVLPEGTAMDANFWAALAGIVWIDLLLSGDNAVVIAMVCSRLPPAQRRMGIILGASAAVGLRIVFAFGVAWLMAVPGLSLIGGLFLLWVATKLVIDHGAEDEAAKPSSTLLGAVTTIAIADAGMSLDNVLAIAALAHGNIWLMALGVLLSIPVVIAGSTLISRLLDRFPILIWAGAALLGWVAGGIIASDSYVKPYVPMDEHLLPYALGAAGLALTLAIGLVMRLRHSRAARA